MADWLIHKYIGILSSRLERFKRKGPNLYNFRCILCGDSEKNRSKARGYIYEREGKLSYCCHNCGAAMSAANFIKTVDNNLYNDMKLEALADKQTTPENNFKIKAEPPVFINLGPFKQLKKVSQLSSNHPIKKFVEGRKIPSFYHSRMLACPNFMEFTNSIVPHKFREEIIEKYGDEMRLIIPFFDKGKNIYAFQGRSLDSKSKTKYITIVIDPEKPKLFGLDTINTKEKIYAFEGPIDSMFIHNSIASAGSDIISAINKTFKRDNLVIVYDNEPRSSETKKKINKAILNGYNVCIWPGNIQEKDVNNMILAGMSSDHIKSIIDENTYKDLTAKLALTKWSKVKS